MSENPDTKYECENSDDHYWADGGELKPHCRKNPN